MGNISTLLTRSEKIKNKEFHHPISCELSSGGYFD